MVERKKLNKLYDLIKCNKWYSLLGTNAYDSHKNLVLKEAYFTFNQLEDLTKLHVDIIRI